MSLGLFPSSAVTVYSSNKNNNKGIGADFLRPLSDNLETTNCQQHNDNNIRTFLLNSAAIEAGTTAAQPQQRQRSPLRRGNSPAQQQPYISGTGGAKRKLSSAESERGMRQSLSSDDDDLDEEFRCDTEPRAKQRRYEERMSTKFSGIRLKDEHGNAAMVEEQLNNRKTADSQQKPWGEHPKQQKQRAGPLIEEVTDWVQYRGGNDDNLFEDESTATFGNTDTAPIVEEPDEGNPIDGTGRKIQTGRLFRHHLVSEASEEDNNELNLDSGCCSSSSSAEGEEQRIELSPELRNLISSLHGQHNNGGGKVPMPNVGRPIRTGKELILFVPSPFSAVSAPSSSSLYSSDKNRVNKEDELLRPRNRVEEVLDDEILPDADDGTPKVLTVIEENWQPTHPLIDGIMSETDDRKSLADTQEEESAMEID